MFDILIIGGGPAGITAGIYAKRANKKVAIMEKFVPGGQVHLIGEIENYPGFSKINGDVLSMKLFNQATDLGIEFIFDEAISYELKGKVKKVICKNQVYESKTIILALGATSKELNVPGERELFGKGISYCAMCDGNFFKGKNVAVIGSGDSSISNALYLANVCKNVYIFAKNDLKLSAYTEEDVKKENIHLYKNVKITKILGESKVETLEYIEKEKTKECKIDGVFIAIGRKPDTNNLQEQIKLDEKGYIIVKDNVKTNISGVFACGDVVSKSLKQIVSAASAGALASTEALKYLIKK